MLIVTLPLIYSIAVWEIISNSSPFGIFILLVLTTMSVVSWIIIFHKWRQFKNVERDNAGFVRQFRNTKRLGEAVGQAKSNPNAPVSGIFLAGYNELSVLNSRKNEAGALQDKIEPLDADDFEVLEMSMERSLTEEMGRLEKQVVFLAITGSSAPFLGLLGTVVGIMDSFWAIGERGSASLAVVAPGIAEALLATIVGLGAAIPAVMAYNWANNKMKFLNDGAGGFILEFIARAHRENR